MDIDGFTIDLNRITRREYREWLQSLVDGTAEERDNLTAEMAERTITAWPFAEPIKAETYHNLGLLDSRRVDDALTEAINSIGKKK